MSKHLHFLATFPLIRCSRSRIVKIVAALLPRLHYELGSMESSSFPSNTAGLQKPLLSSVPDPLSATSFPAAIE